MSLVFSAEELIEFDKRHIWHPYSSLRDPIDPYLVVSAKGVKLFLIDGRELIDGMASWWSCIHGYNHPELNKAITEQLEKMAHVMFGGLTHKPAIFLAQKLLEITHKDLTNVFFCDSGSVAVEVSIKMAYQYWISLGYPNKSKLLTVRCGYHGDTFGAMAVCDPITGMHVKFKNVLPKHFFAPPPKPSFGEEFKEEHITELLKIVEKHHDEIAAVILEPVVQGAGGMRFYSPDYLKRLRDICDEFDILLIFDEIATGFGRTGKLFAYEHADVCPDIMCIGKALTGGYLTFAAVLASDKVADGICSGKESLGVFMHGPTFMANPLASSVSLKSIEILLSSDWKSKVKSIENQLKQGLERAKRFSSVKDVRALGAIGVIEVKRDVNLRKAQKFFVDKGVWIRPFKNLIYIMPAYVITEDELDKLIWAMIKIVEDEEF